MKLKPGVILSAITIYMFSLSASADSLSTELISYIKSELQEIHEADQATRQEIQHALDTHGRDSAEVQVLWQKQSQIDENNRKRVSSILEQYDWPELSDFGDLSAARAILLVIQHGDLAYQLQYFAMAEQAAESGNLQPYLFALLQDR
ncbi:MAG: hypothetical protein LAT66_12210, partial [Alkalimonas sp.]|nr:hypothetical protein [Alkalimonas sp.]